MASSSGKIKRFLETHAPVGTRIRVVDVQSLNDPIEIEQFGHYIGTFGIVQRHLEESIELLMDIDKDTFLLFVSTDKWEVVKD